MQSLECDIKFQFFKLLISPVSNVPSKDGGRGISDFLAVLQKGVPIPSQTRGAGRTDEDSVQGDAVKLC